MWQFLIPGLALVLGLAACGQPTSPPTSVQSDDGSDPEDARADTTATGEFTFGAAGLTSLGLKAQADPPGELRITVSIKRPRAGTNVNKAKATAAFFWTPPAGGTEKLGGVLHVGLTHEDGTSNGPAFERVLNGSEIKALKNTSRSTKYQDGLDHLCAVVILDLKTMPERFRVSAPDTAPLKVCEGASDAATAHNAIQMPLSGIARGGLYWPESGPLNNFRSNVKAYFYDNDYTWPMDDTTLAYYVCANCGDPHWIKGDVNTVFNQLLKFKSDKNGTLRHLSKAWANLRRAASFHYPQLAVFVYPETVTAQAQKSLVALVGRGPHGLVVLSFWATTPVAGVPETNPPPTTGDPTPPTAGNPFDTISPPTSVSFAAYPQTDRGSRVNLYLELWPMPMGATASVSYSFVDRPGTCDVDTGSTGRTYLSGTFGPGDLEPDPLGSARSKVFRRLEAVSVPAGAVLNYSVTLTLGSDTKTLTGSRCFESSEADQ